MRTFLVIVTTLGLILPELLIGNLGLALHLPLYGALYFAVAYRKSAGLLSAAAAGLILDPIYCRDAMLLAFILPGTVLLLLPQVRRLRRKLPLAALLPGMLGGGVMAAADSLLCLGFGSAEPGPDFISMLIFQCGAGGIFMLAFTLAADALAFKCNLPRFGVAGERRNREERL